MRLDYINTFIDSVADALEETSGAPVSRGAIKLRGESSARLDIAAVIGMTGDVDGRVIIEMDRVTALAISGNMNKEPSGELDPLAMDTLRELANILVARAVSALNDRSFVFRLTPPLLFTGADLARSGRINLESLMVPLHANAGTINLHVALTMNT